MYACLLVGTMRRVLSASYLSPPCLPSTFLKPTVPKISMSSSTNAQPKPRVLVLTGPTSVGKSSTALSLCSALDGEIISADSVQLYRHLDIGSNKATKQEQLEIPHHLLDIVDPDVEYTAGDFLRAARAATSNVVSRSKLPVVVGGTMMYVRWYLYGRPATPKPGPESRREAHRLIADAQERNDWDCALKILAERDPLRAQRLSRNDWYRLTRALEVYHTSGGIPMTEMPLVGAAPNSQASIKEEGKSAEEAIGNKIEPSRDAFDFRCVFLYSEDRVEMNRRIDKRSEHMILPPSTTESTENADGFQQYMRNEPSTSWENVPSILSEVTRLLVSGRLRVAPATPCLAIGYRQTITYLAQRALCIARSESSEQGETTLTQAFRLYVDNFQQATRNYAKQQMAWFRKEPKFRWVAAGQDAASNISTLLSLSREEYDQLNLDEEEQQRAIKESIIAQGRVMKRYIPCRAWLMVDSAEEKLAISIGEQCASHIARHIEVRELERILGVVE